MKIEIALALSERRKLGNFGIYSVTTYCNLKHDASSSSSNSSNNRRVFPAEQHIAGIHSTGRENCAVSLALSLSHYVAGLMVYL